MISGSAGGRQWACDKTKATSGSVQTQLKFYEYKYIRHILMFILDFKMKNKDNEGLPYFIYELDSNYIHTLVDKMTDRMGEFEPYISRNTTAHTGYWDI